MNRELQMAYGLIEARLHDAQGRALVRNVELTRADARRARRIERRRVR